MLYFWKACEYLLATKKEFKGIKFVTITEEDFGFPKNPHLGYIGFTSMAQAKAFAKEVDSLNEKRFDGEGHAEVSFIKRRDGWDLYRSTGRYTGNPNGLNAIELFVGSNPSSMAYTSLKRIEESVLGDFEFEAEDVKQQVRQKLDVILDKVGKECDFSHQFVAVTDYDKFISDASFEVLERFKMSHDVRDWHFFIGVEIFNGNEVEDEDEDENW